MKIPKLALIAVAFALSACNTQTSQTASTIASGGLSLVLANNPQYEPDVAATVTALSALNTAPTLGSVATILTTARVNPIITNAVAPLVVSIFNQWVVENPTGTVAQFNTFLANALGGALQLYIAEHPQVLPTLPPATS